MERILERITGEQELHYDREGYLLVRKLIPEDLLRHAERAIRRVIRNHKDATTQSEHHRILQAPAEEPELIAIFNLHFRATAAQLAGEDPEKFAVPREPWALINFPHGNEWQWPEPHVDHALKEDKFRIFPPPFRIASISCLTDVPPHGGGTVVWPGSHKTLAEFVRRNRKSYRYMSDLNLNLHKVSLNSPVELRPCRGDVLFYHYLCAHSAGMNTSRIPRLALGKKW
jgi:ectoine hydroxylase-related dioxygenase (phytanoyl-CoA dioxygenase family)